MRPLLALLVLWSASVAAQSDDDPSPYSEAALVADADAVGAGATLDLALRLDLDEGWHSYWINPGDSGLPVEVEWTLPEGVTARYVLGAAALGGIGFTVSLFVTELAFGEGLIGTEARLGVLIASVVAGLVGTAIVVPGDVGVDHSMDGNTPEPFPVH